METKNWVTCLKKTLQLGATRGAATAPQARRFFCHFFFFLCILFIKISFSSNQLHLITHKESISARQEEIARENIYKSPEDHGALRQIVLNFGTQLTYFQGLIFLPDCFHLHHLMAILKWETASHSGSVLFDIYNQSFLYKFSVFVPSSLETSKGSFVAESG